MKRVSIAFLLVLAASVWAGADQGRTEIGPTDTFPIVIDTPGSYVLTADLHVTALDTNAIEISANDVSLDLGGHVIRGPNAGAGEGTGVSAPSQQGISVRNGMIVEIGIGVDVGRAGSSPGAGTNHLSDLLIRDCGRRGVSFAGGTVRNIGVDRSGSSAFFLPAFECARCSISDVVVRSSYRGIKIRSGSAVNCSAIENQSYGFDIESSTLTGGLSMDNGSYGIGAHAGSVITSCSVVGNGGFGIWMLPDEHCNVVNSTGHDNGGNVSGCGDGNGCHQNYLP